MSKISLLLVSAYVGNITAHLPI